MENNGLLLLNKPSGITSHDLVLKARRALLTSKIGHTGTLDPLAEGLMILTVGKTTKLLPYIVGHDKEYIAELKLGSNTDTDDITGEVTSTSEIPELSEETINSVFESFKGLYLQLPPMYSAKKVNGKKLYELARKNVEIERDPSKVHIYELELLSFSDDTITFRCRCSSGTYIRVLCREIAEKLGTCGCMSKLKRTAIAEFRLSEANNLEQLENGEARLTDPMKALYGYRIIEIDDPADVLDGKRIRIECEDDLVFITYDEKLLAVYEREEGNVFRCRRGLW